MRVIVHALPETATAGVRRFANRSTIDCRLAGLARDSTAVTEPLRIPGSFFSQHAIKG